MNRCHLFALSVFMFFFQVIVLYGRIINVTTEEDFGNRIKQNHTSLVKFYTTWCPACTSLEKSFERLSENAAVQDVQFIAINMDQVNSLASQYDIQYIPQFLLFKNGTLIKKITPLHNSEEEFIQHMLQEINKDDETTNENEHQNYATKIISIITMPIHYLINLVQYCINAIRSWF